MRVLIDDVSWVLIIFDLLIGETPNLRGNVRLNPKVNRYILQLALAFWSLVFTAG
jgi:hypothetical protein